jgi:hypothetical protein
MKYDKAKIIRRAKNIYDSNVTLDGIHWISWSTAMVAAWHEEKAWRGEEINDNIRTI